MAEPTADDGHGGVRYLQDGAVATLLLDRPARRNAIDLPMRHALLAAVRRAAGDDAVRAVVLTGAGGHFCAGGDVRSMQSQADMSIEQGLDRMGPVVACARALLECPKPVVAAVDGVAYGGGLGLALCADLVIATPRARLCASFMRLGLVPDFLTCFTLPRLVGWQKARRLIYTAEEISGTQACDWGLASELVAHELLAERVAEVAHALAELSPTAFRMTKQALLRAFSAEPAAMGDGELCAQAMAFGTAYHQDAVRRFADRQAPRFAYPAAPAAPR